MSLLFQTLHLLLWLYLLVLFGRVILDWVQVLSRDWTPRGVVLVLANGIYALTDPPVRFLRRYIKPVAIGQIRLDLSFIVLFLGIWLTQTLVLPLLYQLLT